MDQNKLPKHTNYTSDILLLKNVHSFLGGTILGEYFVENLVNLLFCVYFIFSFEAFKEGLPSVY